MREEGIWVAVGLHGSSAHHVSTIQGGGNEQDKRIADSLMM